MHKLLAVEHLTRKQMLLFAKALQHHTDREFGPPDPADVSGFTNMPRRSEEAFDSED